MSSLSDILGLDGTEDFQHIDQEWDLIRLKEQNFYPVIVLPENYEVFDFSEGYDPERNLKYPYGLANITNIVRQCMKANNYEETSIHQRTVHIGIDIAAPVQTDIYALKRVLSMQLETMICLVIMDQALTKHRSRFGYLCFVWSSIYIGSHKWSVEIL